MSETVGITPGLPSQIRPGVIIAGKYRLEAEIGRGSMGTVYRAVHVTLGQRVAIKLISTEHLQSSEARHRFSVEAKAAAKLRSRHVVQVYDDGETPEGNPYIVLEHLEGETLEQRIEREHDVPLTEAVRIVIHVGRALARAHAQGIVHRDLKPAHIFLAKAEDDEHGFLAKVLDFGIAKLDQGEKGTTQAGTLLGTPLFMSPEQVRGASSVDHRADLYSLGMCLFNMLTGEFAFYSKNYGDVLVSICTERLPELRAMAPWVPPAVELWFQRACARDAIERFQSADEMTEALAAAAGGPPAPSKHQSVPEGRIAPETLMGFAPPTLTATSAPGNTGTLHLARTQVVASPVVRSSGPNGIVLGEEARASSPQKAKLFEPPLHAAASPISTAGVSHHPPSAGFGSPNDSSTRARAGSTGSDIDQTWKPTSRGLAPFLVGGALGLSAVLIVGLTLLVSTGSAPGVSGVGRAATSVAGAGRPSVPSARPAAIAPSAAAPRSVDLAPPPPSAVRDVSSAAAAGAATSPVPSPKQTSVKRAPIPPKPASRSGAPRPVPASSPGSDLGF